MTTKTTKTILAAATLATLAASGCSGKRLDYTSLAAPTTVRFTTSVLERLPVEEQERLLGRAGVGGRRTRVLIAPDDLTIGPKDAPVVLVGFVDLEDSNSARAVRTLRDAQAAHPKDVRVVLKPLPVPDSPVSWRATQALLAARDQGKGWELAACALRIDEALHESALGSCAVEVGLDVARFEADTASEASLAAAATYAGNVSKLAIAGTPTFFLNGYRIEGVPTDEQLEDQIDVSAKHAKSVQSDLDMSRGGVYPELMRTASLPVPD